VWYWLSVLTYAYSCILAHSCMHTLTHNVEHCITILQYYRKPLVAVASTSQPILNEREVNTIFFIGIEELQQLHVEIYRMLEPRVQAWSATVCVGDVFVELVCHCM